MKAPKKLYLHPTAKGEVGANWLTFQLTNEDVEYVRTDTFIEKVEAFLWAHTPGTDVHVNYIVKKFKEYMKE